MSDETVGRTWQVGVWDKISQLYPSEIDPRFEPVVDGVIRRAALRPGDHVLDLGTGTGTVAERAASAVAPDGSVLAVDISPEMLSLSRERLQTVPSCRVEEGGAEEIPAPDASFDVVLASLSMMYVVDRPAAAREIARVLRPGGRFVAAVWAGPAACDIVLFQQTAGSFAPSPPVAGVGPGALADPTPFVEQLAAAGIDATIESDVLGFEFGDFDLAWTVLAGVTTAQLPSERQEEAKAAVRDVMWPDPTEPRAFRNKTLFLLGRRH